MAPATTPRNTGEYLNWLCPAIRFMTTLILSESIHPVTDVIRYRALGVLLKRERKNYMSQASQGHDGESTRPLT